MSKAFPQHLLKKKTPEGSFMFLYIDKPDYAYKDVGEYSASLLLPNVIGKDLVNEIDNLISKTKEGIRQHDTPLVTLPYEILYEGTCEKYFSITGVQGNVGDYLIKFRTNAKFRDKKNNTLTDNKIEFFDESNNPIRDTSHIMRGSKGVITYDFFPWTMGNRCGVRCTLHEISFTDIISKQVSVSAVS